MSIAGLRGFQLVADDIHDVASTLSPAEWSAPSGAGGWSVHDVVLHTAELLGFLIEAVTAPPTPAPGTRIEDLNEVQVAAIELILTGPVPTSVTLLPAGDQITVSHDSPVAPAATVTSPALEFLAWSTTRLRWSEHTTVAGDPKIATTFFDALNVI